MKGSRKDDFQRLLEPLRAWGRWGSDDQRGAMNLIDADKVRRAASLVRSGVRVSLSREVPTRPAENNPYPAEHFMRTISDGESVIGSVDYLGIGCHGGATTHIDALSHLWGESGMWNGRDPANEITFDGAQWGGLEHWSDGFVTRGVLFDVAQRRSQGYVDIDAPVTGDELASIAEVNGTTIEPGDALVIYSGRETWEEANGRLWGAPGADGAHSRPGLDASCLTYFHAVDCSMIVWDMMDARPNEYGVFHGPHVAIYNQGLALVDNAFLQPLADACAERDQCEFLLVVAPLVLRGGTGCAVNPIAIL
jgi:kynurenine formamidase